jgi:putative ABC transport system permease protein
MEHCAGGSVAGRMRAQFKGITPPTLEYDLDNYVISEGQTFTALDYERGSQAALISNNMADELRKKLRMSGQDTMVIGQYLTFGGLRLRITGIFSPKDEKMRGWGMRHRVYIPLMTMQKYISGFDPNPGSLMLKVADHNKLDEQLEAIVAALIARHRGVEDFEYNKAQGVEDAIAMIKNITLLMGIIAAISLLVGGLGIMNVTLASISERIREIGTRKALGASPAQVFIQFIAETTTLSLTGGLLGLPLGCFPLIFADQIRKATPLSPTLQLSHVIIIPITLVSIGIIFGLYPAIKASRMNPIDALRYE